MIFKLQTTSKVLSRTIQSNIYSKLTPKNITSVLMFPLRIVAVQLQLEQLQKNTGPMFIVIQINCYEIQQVTNY